MWRMCRQLAPQRVPAGCPPPPPAALLNRARHATPPLLAAVTDLRLVGGPNPNSGRLELKIGGWWGTVCANDPLNVPFDDKAAAVACRQLGLAGGLAHRGAYYGEGSAELGVLM